MSAKQKRRRETASNSTQVLAAPSPVIDHARPQVSNNLSWHFIQAADQRGSGISGAWSSELGSRASTDPPLDVGKSSDQSSNQSSDQSSELRSELRSELGSRPSTDPPLDVGKSSDPSNQVSNLRSAQHDLCFQMLKQVVTVFMYRDLGGSSQHRRGGVL